MFLKRLLIYVTFLFGAAFFFGCQKDYNNPLLEESPYFGVKTEVYVNAIQINQFPALAPSGFEWDSIYTDSLRFPDVFYSLAHEPDTTGNGFYQSTKFDNVDPAQLPLIYTLTSPYKVYGFDSLITMNVYDYEKIDTVLQVDSTLMTTFNFSIAPGDSTIPNADPYPQSVLVGNSDYSVRLYLTWK
jgi:hypothetical protein